MSETYLKFDSPSFEKVILSYFLKDRTSFLRLAKYLTTSSWSKNSYFNDPKLQFFMNCFAVYNEKYFTMPSRATVYSIIEKSFKEKSDQDLFKATFDSILKTPLDGESPEYIREQIVSFIQKERALRATYENQADIAKGNYDNLSKRMSDAVNINLDKDLGVDIKDVATTFSMIKELQDTSKGCTWGSPTLDNILGRIQPGELGVIAGVPGAGKTAWLGHFGTENMKDGKNVALFSFEVNKKRLSTRLYKSLFNVSGKRLLEMDSQTALNILDGVKGDIQIIDREANKCSANDMSAILKDLHTYNNFTPDLILVDYIAITAANDRRLDPSNSFKYYKTVSEELRNLGKEFNCPVISASQLNREAMGDKGGSKAVVSAKSLAESRGVLDTADTLLIIEQTDQDKYSDKSKKIGKYRIKIDKNRNGESQSVVEFNIDWNTMRITEAPSK